MLEMDINSSTNWILIILFTSIFPILSIGQTKPGWNPKKCLSSKNKKNCHRKNYFGYDYLRQRDHRDQIPTIPTVPGQFKGSAEEPVRSRYYNPSYGYEPYWPGGHWVFKTTTSSPNTTFCKEESYCNPIYERYGKICGRNNLTETRTFDNFCQMRSVDCNNFYGWYVVHRGNCRPLPKVYTGLTQWTIFNRSRRYHIRQKMAMTYIDSFHERYTAKHLNWRKTETTALHIDTAPYENGGGGSTGKAIQYPRG